MYKTKGYAAFSASAPLAPYEIQRRSPKKHDVVIAIDYCGVCHSDLHQVKNEWASAVYPMVPGHEIVGRVIEIGTAVSKFKVGDLAGVGCLVDSCRTCNDCLQGQEQFCDYGRVGTYNSIEKDGVTRTFGGYSQSIVVDENFTLKIPSNLELSKVAPLLCAGITTYSPLKHWNIGPGKKVGVVGLGGLGHMAVKFAKAFGAKVSVFSRSEKKKADALKLGADEVILTNSPDKIILSHNKSFDMIIDTVSAPHDLNLFLQLLKRDGSCVLLGLPDIEPTINIAHLIMGRKNLSGSLIGGIAETQEMLDFCSAHNITCEVELISPEKINEAFERMMKSDVHYRFVLDMKTL